MQCVQSKKSDKNHKIVLYEIMADEKYEKFVLEEDQELRISTQENDEENIEIEMVYGTGEIFGYELKKDVRYTFGQGDKFSIFSFQGRIIYDFNQLQICNATRKTNYQSNLDLKKKENLLKD